MSRLRNKFTEQDITEALACSGNNITQAARDLSDLGRGIVTRQLLQYWMQNLKGVETAVETIQFDKTEGQKRTAQIENNRLRKITRDVLDAERTKEEVLDGIRHAVEKLNIKPATKMAIGQSGKDRPMTVELLFSDLQIGKLMSRYDTDIAIKRLREYAQVAIHRIVSYIDQGYYVERIILASIGDIIESDKKHANSARATDTGTAAQIADAVTYIMSEVIDPLAELGIPTDVVCVTGNHDHDDHGLVMFKPGKEQLSWPMYHALRLISEAKGYHHFAFHIPEGAFHVDEIYGCKVLYEHGVGTAASEASMRKRMADRTKQIKSYITMFRMGDKHNICRFNNDTMVVNGAFFGDDREGSEFSGICGYDGYPAQIMFAYVPRDDDRRLPIYDSLAIQLGHIT